ncbi:hypothetical protein [Legionella septentrionalis]|uniref:Uncharacterized protein n=1 Tax=Legionella septentrionalis TaxID=2498109 RepID=A0A433JLP1_9GAMM|nr:hypothetical protein [Legionella septentrionalis]RUQ89993.1 hypothetical protein EKM59_02275 [Legionella septentrionalis]
MQNVYFKNQEQHFFHSFPAKEKNSLQAKPQQVLVNALAREDLTIAADLPSPLKPNSFALIKKTDWQIFYVNAEAEPLLLNPDDFPNKSAVENLKKILAKTASPQMPLLQNLIIRAAVETVLASDAKFNLCDEVGIGECKRGKFLFSNDFGPCQIVFARLTNGDYALFHATKMVHNNEMQQFVDLIKKDVVDVFVVQKRSLKVNLDKAPSLAISLAKELGRSIVKRLEVADYHGIVIDGHNKQVIIAPNVVKQFSGKKLEVQGELIKQNYEQGIDINQSIFDAFKVMNFEYNKLHKKTESLPSVVIGLVEIPGAWVIDAATSLRKSHPHNNNFTTFFPQEEKPLSLEESLKIICGTRYQYHHTLTKIDDLAEPCEETNATTKTQSKKSGGCLLM